MEQDTFVIDTIRTGFELEISNIVEFVNNEIIVHLADGTKAKIRTKNVA